MHPEIEKLIDLALADGEISEKERNVILKKAAEHGVDSDEVEMVMDGMLHQLEKSKPKLKEKVGKIKICPTCGGGVKSFQSVCESCGHEFNGVGGSAAVSNFSNGINSIKKTYKGSRFTCGKCKSLVVTLTDNSKCVCHKCGHVNVLNDYFKGEDIEGKIAYINSFVIPHDKESVLSLLFLFYNEASKKVDADDGLFVSAEIENAAKLQESFMGKFLQTYEIAKILLLSEPSSILQINAMKDELIGNKKQMVANKQKEEFGLYVLIVAVLLIAAIMIIFGQ
jgi:hypothetical protein